MTTTTTTIAPADLDAAIAEYLDVLRIAEAKKHVDAGYTIPMATYSIDTTGRKFTRVVRDTGGSYGRSVHAFVERSTGRVVKAAGWKAPAKRSNGDLQSQFTLADEASRHALFSAVDPYGSYLYMR